jgi:ubiquitin carboxyl-terminal hydrolase 14
MSIHNEEEQLLLLLLSDQDPGLPASNFQGQYELFAVVTHEGCDAVGGHYMTWVKASNSSGKVEKIADSEEDNEDWFVFDDDEVSPCKSEDLLK